MIVSFHPCYEADTNRLCAGREPDAADRAAVRQAQAVILPQGCRESLYRLARENCAHVFPNYDVRFQYPGKTGQARLFETLGLARPRTWVFETSHQFRNQWPHVRDARYPLVLKLDWGGEGDTVFLLPAPADLEHAVAMAADYERTGQSGFVIQSYIPHGNRCLRVAVIGDDRQAYWRVQEPAAAFGTSVARGARIDKTSDPHLRRQALDVVATLCRRSGINLAGIDLIFNETDRENQERQPLLLEINYFFGRAGLGGSQRFYALLQAAVDRWLAKRGVALRRPPAGATAKEDQ